MNFTEAHARAKQRFWRKIKGQGAAAEPLKLENVQIARLSGNQQVAISLSDPTFYDWFMNEKTEEDLIKAGAEGAIRCLIDIISGAQEVKSAAAQVTAAKILLDMAGYGSKAQQKEVVYKDAEIGKMSEDELRTYIEKQANRFTTTDD